MNYLEFLYYGKGISSIYVPRKAFYHAQKQGWILSASLIDFKRVYEKLNVLISFNPDVKTQQGQPEQIAVISFLGSLPQYLRLLKIKFLFTWSVLG